MKFWVLKQTVTEKKFMTRIHNFKIQNIILKNIVLATSKQHIVRLAQNFI